MAQKSRLRETPAASELGHPWRRGWATPGRSDLFGDEPLLPPALSREVRGSAGILFVGKPSSHPLIQTYSLGRLPPPRDAKRGKQRSLSLRWINEFPCNARMPSSSNWSRSRSQCRWRVTYRTALSPTPGRPENVAELAACGRARWTIENETFHVSRPRLTTRAQFGHGKLNLGRLWRT